MARSNSDITKRKSFGFTQSKNDSPIINVNYVEVETLTNLHGQVEESISVIYNLYTV